MGKNTYTLYLTNPLNPPPLAKGEIMVNGHTHVPCQSVLENGTVYFNCGSVALPKEDTPHSYLLIENDVVFFKDLESGGIFDSYNL